MRIPLLFLILSVLLFTDTIGQENICDSDVCAQICNPDGDSYKCDCIKGFTLMEDGVSCKPEKRALKKGGRCEKNNPCEQDCIDTGTLIKCSCREGYELDLDERSCKDIDECKLGIHECLENEDCENEIGTYACYDKEVFGENDVDFDKKCPAGFRFNIENGACDDINECLFDLMCVAPKVCKNTIGSFICEQVIPNCPPGFTYNDTIATCDDIDECHQTPSVCKKTEDCINEPGGFKCIEKPSTTTSTTTTIKKETTPKYEECQQGYYYSFETHKCEDINECSTRTHACDVLERCDNTMGSYHCSRIYGCGTGYTLNIANGLCEDDNECLLGTHDCNKLGPNFKCKNTFGSYRCEMVRQIMSTTNKPPMKTFPSTTITTSSITTTSSTTESMKPTTKIIPKSVPTVSVTRGQYFPFYSYNNTLPELPFYSSKAYTTQISTTMQTPLAPERRPHIFLIPSPSTPYIPFYSPANPQFSHNKPVPTTIRHNIIGGQLKKCLPGYQINARGECEDIDECESNPCAKYEKCLNFNGRYKCAAPMECRFGYELNEAGDSCVDIDECTRGTHKCNPTQICRNYEGFHVCECPPGHQPRFDMCEDIDECRMFRPCGSNSNCINTKGSFKCECKEGFRKHGNMCEEINECIENAGLCEQRCVNIWGSYRCSCNPGFYLNPDNRTCTDIDECERFKDKRLCIGNCRNVPGSYTCDCPKGYVLGSDGRICRDIDECQQNMCLEDEVCLNLRGSFRCYSIKCPSNYIKDPGHKTRCKRLQQSCDIRDYECLMMPSQYAYQYIAMVSNLPMANSGPVQIAEIKGPAWFTARAEFTMKLVDVVCPHGIQKADDSYFLKRHDRVNSITIALTKSIQGPQEIKLQIQMKFYNGNVLMGNNIIYIIIVVSEHSF